MSTAKVPTFEIVRFDASPGWRQTASKFFDNGAHVKVEQAAFTTPTRSTPVPWTIVHRKAAVAICAVTEDKRYVLVQQERIPVCQSMWEFPAGQVDVPPNEVTREAVVATVLNELKEETGCELLPGGELIPLGHYFPSAGFTQEVIYLFLATSVRIMDRPQPVGHEQIEAVRCVTFDELSGMMARNELTASVCHAIFAKLVALHYAQESASADV